MRQRWLLYALVAGIGLVFLFVASLNTGPAVAKPEFGGNCASCHPNGIPKAAQPEPKAEQPKSSQPAAKPAATQAAPKAAPAPAVTTKQIELNALGKTKNVNAAVVEGRTLLAVRDVIELLGGTVSWDPKGVVTFKARNTTITMSTKAKEATVNGKPVTIDVGARLVKNQTMVPLRFVAEKLGLKVDASADGKKITISYLLGLNKDTALPGYVGSATCKTCHAQIYAAWQGTRHSKMLQDPKTPGAIVLGDFSTNTYFKWEDVKYIVGTGLEGGQRYVGEKDGKLMYLPANWDNEKRQWVKADPREYTCAACHTVGYNKETNTWAENGIGCEACHGPGAEHVKAPSKANIKSGVDVDMCSSCHGEDRQTGQMKEQVAIAGEGGGHLKIFANASVAEADRYWKSNCFRCHSATYKVAQLTGKPVPKAEDFLTGSLKNDRVGITCVVCHDPHANTGHEYQLRKDPMETCTQCHQNSTQPVKAGMETHHSQMETFQGLLFKGDGTVVNVPSPKANISCADCHMTDGNHIWEVGTPTLTLKSHGKPYEANSCAKCHSNMTKEKIEAIQKEFEEKYETLKAKLDAIKAKYDQAPEATKAKAKSYVDAATTDLALFESDGSKGIHNVPYFEALFAQVETDLAQLAKLLP